MKDRSHGLALGVSFLLLLIVAGIAQSDREKNKTTVVSHLPGFDGPLPFSLETGYVEVDDRNGVRLFYYFVQSEANPAEDPVLLWLTGGPGCSAFSGLVYEIGPLSFQPDSYTGGVPELVYRPDSWTKVANVIFLDSPVGAGFSYSATDQGYKSCDTKAVDQIAIFLTKWYEEHPQFLSNPLFIAGDSYSGLIAPPLTFQIAKGIEMGDKPLLNLKGYIIGNPLTDRKFDLPARVPYAHRMGLISDEQYETYRESCGADTSMNRNIQCKNCHDAIDKCLKGINIHHILEPECSSEYNGNSDSGRTLFDYGGAELGLSDISSECREKGYSMSGIWANNRSVREALGVHKGTVPLWLRCNHGTPYTTDIRSIVEFHRSVTSRGYRSLIYSGDHDMTVPFISTQAWIRSLGFAVVDEWRPWYATGQVAGFTTLYANNLTFATVKGGGHTAPEYMPKECLAMVDRWLSGRPV
ncbi:serine carboxypeptidase-like 17 [Aegilops tauschii subsp. strangulata]|uniref:Serine carboxypeptidase-like 18 n=1 Tax=Aegilops tauschii subsp. strangulata TaxID=200361 RepID=A0A453E4C2_AEGTS|nr:serine carboxypeptidase-like 17 [Aegilops tauschii subsp. strangulata]